jgi:hypothetical protein
MCAYIKRSFISSVFAPGSFLKKYSLFICIVCIIAITLVLRLYNLFDTVAFRPDQARDLFIARNIAENRSWIPVGPVLTVDHYNVPPTYFYIVALMYSVFKTPQGVTFAFTIMNLCAMCCMVGIASLLIERKAGVIMAFLFAVSSIMVGESRMIWGSHPLTFLITASLFSLLLASIKKSLALFLISASLYACALSIYSSPFLLLPFYIVSGITCIKKMYGFTSLRASLTMAGIMISVSIPFFGPYLYYEYSHGFPTVSAMTTPSFGVPPLSEFFSAAVTYITGFAEDVFGIHTIGTPAAQPYYAIGIIILFSLLSWYIKHKRFFITEVVRTEKFIAYRWLLLGACFILFFRQTLYTYRLSVFIPFILIQLTLLLYVALRIKKMIPFFLAGALLSVYVVCNIRSVNEYYFRYSRNDVTLASSVASFIGRDMAGAGIHSNQIALYAYNNSIFRNDRFLYPFLYYLIDFARFSSLIIPPGNTIDFDALHKPDAQTAYLICTWYRNIETARVNCVQNFLKEHPSYRSTHEQEIDKETIVVTLRITPEEINGKSL